MAKDDGKRLGELLIRENRITLAVLKEAQEEQKRTGVSLAAALAKIGAITDQEIAAFNSQLYGVPSVDLERIPIDQELARILGRSLCERHRMIPISRAGASVILAMADPTDMDAMDAARFKMNYNVERVVASEHAIAAMISRVLDADPSINMDQLLEEFDVTDVAVSEDDEEEVNASELRKASEDAPVVKLCHAILLSAIRKGASDIHVEPYEKKMRVRFRIDGILQEEMTPPLKLKDAIVSRLKIMANLNIAERRIAQDGRIKIKLGGGREMDFRVSVLPVLWGEKVVLRLLDKSNLQLDMTKLGFDATQLEWLTTAIHQPYGMVLVTGPTGSGKTTTLYSALAELNKTSDNICTAEDPIEYNLPGINQTQTKDDIGWNFSTALRSFLRQDPDIIMVGEIRDFETAEIAVKAALTGHMVLSTLHTNDAPGTVSRLLNMGIEPFLVTASTNLILAQRLVRKVCNECRVEAKVAPQILLEMGFTEEQVRTAKFYRGIGCRSCNNTGYKGRVALYEVMPFWDELKDLVLQGASTSELKAQAIRCGLRTLRSSGLQKCLDGVTTTEEVLRVTTADDHRSR